jgi:DNA-directed RNA polymerase II subunit RPB11
LKQKENVKFVGYRKPHPLQNLIELKIQTTEDMRPYDAFKDGVKELKVIGNKLKRSFQDQMKKLNSLN